MCFTYVSVYIDNVDVCSVRVQPENLMLLDRNSTRLKIIDFGLSRKFVAGDEVKEMMGTPEFVGESPGGGNMILIIVIIITLFFYSAYSCTIQISALYNEIINNYLVDYLLIYLILLAPSGA